MANRRYAVRVNKDRQCRIIDLNTKRGKLVLASPFNLADTRWIANLLNKGEHVVKEAKRERQSN